MWRSCRCVNDWTNITWDKVSIPKSQKTLEDNLQDQKFPETPVMTLDPQTVTKVFLKMTVLLGKLWGITGIPLSYVVQFILMSLNNLTYDDPIRDYPLWSPDMSTRDHRDKEVTT